MLLSPADLMPSLAAWNLKYISAKCVVASSIATRLAAGVSATRMHIAPAHANQNAQIFQIIASSGVFFSMARGPSIRSMIALCLKT